MPPKKTYEERSEEQPKDTFGNTRGQDIQTPVKPKADVPKSASKLLLGIKTKTLNDLSQNKYDNDSMLSDIKRGARESVEETKRKNNELLMNLK